MKIFKSGLFIFKNKRISYILTSSKINKFFSSQVDLTDNDQDFYNYVSKFPEFNQLITANDQHISIKDFVYTKEAITINYLIMNNNFSNAENELKKIKSEFRSKTKHPELYCFILRRLGIVRIKSNKIKEGLLDLENVYELCKNLNEVDINMKFNSILDLILAYLKYENKKVFRILIWIRLSIL
jgi:hypothetical protein